MGDTVRERLLLSAFSLAAVIAASIALTACTASATGQSNPELAPRDTVMTTAKPTRQDLENRLSLSGKVEMSPVFGLVAPVGGRVRYLSVQQPRTTPTKPTKVANIWVNGKATKVEVPAGATFTRPPGG